MFKHKLGIVTGLIFGLIAPYLVALGLISLTIEMMSPFITLLMFPFGFFLRFLSDSSQSSALFNMAILLNVVLFAFIGFFIQRNLRKRNKNEKIVLYIFLAVVALFVLLLIIDGLLGRLGA